MGLATGVLAAAITLLAGVGSAAAVTGPQLTTDSGGRPLLTGSDLAPGRQTENCLVLTYTGLPAGVNGVGMYGVPAGSGLADYLDLTIDVGSGGGRFGNCSGFAGATVFSGSLTAFGQAYAAPAGQLLVATVPSPAGEVTVRVRLRLRDDNRAQGRTASAIFSWTVGPVVLPVGPVVLPVGGGGTPTSSSSTSPGRTGTGPVPTPTTEPTPGPTSSSAGTPPEAGAPTPSVSPAVEGSVQTAGPGQQPAPGAAPSQSPPAVPLGPPLTSVNVPLLPAGPARSPAPSSPAAGPPLKSEDGKVPGGAGGSRAPTAEQPATVAAGPAAQIAEAIRELVTTAQQAAPSAAKGGALGLGTLPFVLLFLLIQKRLDERDPKLALAPSYEDAFLLFEDSPLTRSDGLLP